MVPLNMSFAEASSMCCVLILAGPHNFMVDDSLDMHKDNEDPEEEEYSSHSCSHLSDGCAL